MVISIKIVIKYKVKTRIILNPIAISISMALRQLTKIVRKLVNWLILMDNPIKLMQVGS